MCVFIYLIDCLFWYLFVFCFVWVFTIFFGGWFLTQFVYVFVDGLLNCAFLVGICGWFGWEDVYCVIFPLLDWFFCYFCFHLYRIFWMGIGICGFTWILVCLFASSWFIFPDFLVSHAFQLGGAEVQPSNLSGWAEVGGRMAINTTQWAQGSYLPTSPAKVGLEVGCPRPRGHWARY